MHIEFTELIGKTLLSAENINSEEVVFTTTDGEIYKLFHEQSCCEEVTVQSIAGGALNDLIGSPIISVDEFESADGCLKDYAINTDMASIDIIWYGSLSEGSSELVSFIKKV